MKNSFQIEFTLVVAGSMFPDTIVVMQTCDLFAPGRETDIEYSMAYCWLLLLGRGVISILIATAAGVLAAWGFDKFETPVGEFFGWFFSMLERRLTGNLQCMLTGFLFGSLGGISLGLISNDGLLVVTLSYLVTVVASTIGFVWLFDIREWRLIGRSQWGAAGVLPGILVGCILMFFMPAVGR